MQPSLYESPTSEQIVAGLKVSGCHFRLPVLRTEFSCVGERLFDTRAGFEDFDFGQLVPALDFRVQLAIFVGWRSGQSHGHSFASDRCRAKRNRINDLVPTRFSPSWRSNKSDAQII